MSEVVRTCFECGRAMELRMERPDPHELAVRMWLCAGCGHTEEPGMDVEAHEEDRPRLPGL